MKQAPSPASIALVEIFNANPDLFSSLPGDVYSGQLDAQNGAATNEYELDSFPSRDDDPEYADQIAIILAMTLTAEGQDVKPMAMLSMDYHQSEVGVNDRHWISLKDDPVKVEANFRRTAFDWGVAPSLVDKGVAYIDKCRALVAELGERVAVSDLVSPAVEGVSRDAQLDAGSAAQTFYQAACDAVDAVVRRASGIDLPAQVEPSSPAGQAAYDAVLRRAAGVDLPTLVELKGYIGVLLEDQSILEFADFDAFYAWIDTVTHYEQQDADEEIMGHRDLLEIAYGELVEEAGQQMDEAPGGPGF